MGTVLHNHVSIISCGNTSACGSQFVVVPGSRGSPLRLAPTTGLSEVCSDGKGKFSLDCWSDRSCPCLGLKDSCVSPGGMLGVSVRYHWCRFDLEAHGRILCYAVCSTAPLAVACSLACRNISTPCKSLKGDAFKTTPSSFVCAIFWCRSLPGYLLRIMGCVQDLTRSTAIHKCLMYCKRM